MKHRDAKKNLVRKERTMQELDDFHVIPSLKEKKREEVQELMKTLLLYADAYGRMVLIKDYHTCFYHLFEDDLSFGTWIEVEVVCIDLQANEWDELNYYSINSVDPIRFADHIREADVSPVDSFAFPGVTLYPNKGYSDVPEGEPHYVSGCYPFGQESGISENEEFLAPEVNTFLRTANAGDICFYSVPYVMFGSISYHVACYVKTDKIFADTIRNATWVYVHNVRPDYENAPIYAVEQPSFSYDPLWSCKPSDLAKEDIEKMLSSLRKLNRGAEAQQHEKWKMTKHSYYIAEQRKPPVPQDSEEEDSSL